MKAQQYRSKIPVATKYFRMGRTFEQIAGICGGSADMWGLILELAGEATPDTLGFGSVQDAFALRAAGWRMSKIAEKFGVSQATLWRHMKGKSGIRVRQWDDARLVASEALADYKEGLTLEAIAWKYGYRSNRVALAAIERLERILEGD